MLRHNHVGLNSNKTHFLVARRQGCVQKFLDTAKRSLLYEQPSSSSNTDAYLQMVFSMSQLMDIPNWLDAAT